MNVTDYNADGRRIEVRITGNTNADHRLTLTPRGTVTDHWCDRYPTADEHTAIERERLNRVERFGKYYLQRTTGFDGFTPYEDQIADPRSVTITAVIIATMSQERVTQQFSACYEQLTVPQKDDTLPVTRPQNASHAEMKCIEQDVYLTVSPDAVSQLYDVLSEACALKTLRQALDIQPDKEDKDHFDRLGNILEAVGASTHGTGPFLQTGAPLRVHWNTDGPVRVKYQDSNDSRPEGPIATRIQLTPHHQPIISPAAFQRTLVDHLRCQLRDCYIGMGLRPPGHARNTGPGIRACTECYESVQPLQRYHDQYAIIDWNVLGPRPDF
jgi:hypothetical protein